MAPQKRKRKFPKRECPCCGKDLSEKTIQNHLEGKHLPTRIQITHSMAAHNTDLQPNSPALSGNSSDYGDFSYSDDDSVHSERLNPADSELADGNTVSDGSGDHNIEMDTVLKAAQHAINTTWSGRRAEVQDYESDTEDEDEDSMLLDSESDTDSESDEETPEDGTQNGRGIEDQMEEDFQRLLAEFTEELSEDDIDMLCTFSMKIEDHLSDEGWLKMMYIYHRHNIPSLRITKARIAFLAAYRPVPYDCCVNSCICYVGPHEEKTECPYCHEPRRNHNGRARKTFSYSPIIPRLKAMFKNSEAVKCMSYRADFALDPSVVRDIFDGNNYQDLKETDITIGGISQGRKFFSDPRDIALGLSLDGFCPFKRRKLTCWPIILFNYNLPPEIRFHLRHILCVGAIPGKPKDADSFAYPLVEELLEFLAGIRTYDASKDELFDLHAFLVLAFGDIPAISMIMRMKGHNGIFPCRMCMIKGVRVPNSRNTTHYVPLFRANHPTVLLAPGDYPEIPSYNAAQLPLRTHQKFIEDANHVQFAYNSAEEQRRSKACGIKGIPLLSHLPSLFFPLSFPYDFMHLIWENLIKNLVLLWTGKFKGLDEGKESYELNLGVWEAIGEATKAAGASIPAAYANARPQNVAEDPSACTADSWSFWTLYLGPILLRGRFEKRVYYDHFIKLVKLLNICLQFEITKQEVSQIREGFQEWVESYEKIYYQNSPDRVSACPLTVHALLHIADGIDATGPVWAYWAFLMERFCGHLSRCIKSRRYPFSNLNSYLTANAQLDQIKNRYDAHETLATLPRKEGNSQEINVEGYPMYALCVPRKKNPVIEAGLLAKILSALATRYNTTVSAVRRHFTEATVEFFGKIRRLEGGDTMRAAAMTHSNTEDGRDATYVRYELYVDRHANFPRRRPHFDLKTFYGQLRHIIHIEMPATQQLGMNEPETIVLASIRNCNIERHNDLDMHYYKDEGYTEVVDITTIQCLVGRVLDRGWWTIIDRSGKLAQSSAFEE